jgi:hypothetical protein
MMSPRFDAIVANESGERIEDVKASESTSTPVDGLPRDL